MDTNIVYYRVKLEDIVSKLENVLRSDPRVEIAVLFGSVLYSNDVRDIDIAIYAYPPLALKELLLLGDKLERIINIPVDLVPLNEIPPSLQYKVLIEGKPLVVKNKDLYNKLILSALGQIQDIRLKEGIT